ncbi:Pyruvate dehydrogenase [ubiquinone] [Rothia kristinae]|nr:Pyruvate dehydrogenase [ubiquinone] [Rothia kristinae]
MTGLLGYGAAAEGIHDADLMIMIGTDFPYDQFLPETTTIQIDTDPSVMGRRTDVDLQIEGSALETLRACCRWWSTRRTASGWIAC